jgi:hypothetical protein
MSVLKYYSDIRYCIYVENGAEVQQFVRELHCIFTFERCNFFFNIILY